METSLVLRALCARRNQEWPLELPVYQVLHGVLLGGFQTNTVKELCRDTRR